MKRRNFTDRDVKNGDRQMSTKKSVYASLIISKNNYIIFKRYFFSTCVNGPFVDQQVQLS